MLFLQVYAYTWFYIALENRRNAISLLIVWKHNIFVLCNMVSNDF